MTAIPHEDESTRERIMRIINGEDLLLRPRDIESSSTVAAAISEDSPRAARANRVEALKLAVDSAIPGATPTQIIRGAAAIYAYAIEGKVPDSGEQS